MGGWKMCAEPVGNGFDNDGDDMVDWVEKRYRFYISASSSRVVSVCDHGS
jgi:hypothetical protein